MDNISGSSHALVVRKSLARSCGEITNGRLGEMYRAGTLTFENTWRMAEK
jgi:hypothetical protein